jgi:hypothetical protein
MNITNIYRGPPHGYIYVVVSQHRGECPARKQFSSADCEHPDGIIVKLDDIIVDSFGQEYEIKKILDVYNTFDWEDTKEVLIESIDKSPQFGFEKWALNLGKTRPDLDQPKLGIHDELYIKQGY